MNEMKPFFKRWLLAKCAPVKSFAFRKVSAEVYNFSGPVYKGVPLPWMKWNPSLTMTASQVYPCAKDSLAEKLVLTYDTLGSPFIRGFPSHEWNDTHPLTMTARQL